LAVGSLGVGVWELGVEFGGIMRVLRQVPLGQLGLARTRRVLALAITLAACVAMTTAIIGQQRGELSGTARVSGTVTALASRRRPP
jgi:hypothetical protein